MKDDLTLAQAVDDLSNGHSNYYPHHARTICKAIGVPFPESLVHKQYMEYPLDFKGLFCNPEADGQAAVYSLSLSQYVAEQLKVSDKAGSYFGRGTQARAYAEQVRKKLEADGRDFEATVPFETVDDSDGFEPRIHITKKLKEEWGAAIGLKIMNGAKLRLEEFKLAIIIGAFKFKKPLKNETEIAEAYIEYRKPPKPEPAPTKQP